MDDVMDDVMILRGDAAAGEDGLRRFSLSGGGAGAGGSNDISQLLDLQRSEQLSSLDCAASAAVGPVVSNDQSMIAGASSLVLPAGSVAGVAPAALLQALGSVTSKTPAAAAAAGSALAGIDWAAIKSEALKAMPAQQAGGRHNQQPEQQQQQGELRSAAAAAAASGGDDAPYNPDDDDDGLPYNPTEGAAGYHETEAKSSQKQAAMQQEPQQQQQQQQRAADVPDLLPVISAQRPGTIAAAQPMQPVWQGSFSVPGASSFAAEVKYLGGVGEVGLMLGPEGAVLDIIGRVALDKFAGFTEELRKSRSRTISLGLVNCAAGAPPQDASYMRELLSSYSSKGRIGKLRLQQEVEGYLVAQGGECQLAAAPLIDLCSNESLKNRPCGGWVGGGADQTEASA
jgi:hypothetical protein